MKKIVVAIVYHSGAGHTARQAAAVGRGIDQISAVTSLLLTSEEAQKEWEKLEQADAIISESRRHALENLAVRERPLGFPDCPGRKPLPVIPPGLTLDFLDEHMALVPASNILDKFRELCRFVPVVVLVPKSTVSDKTTQKKPSPNKSAVGFTDTRDVCLSLDAVKTWIRTPNATDTFAFGGVKGCFSTMEIDRDGRPVTLTGKEFKTLAYFIKNPRRVISRDELLNEVWGYENYPCTRTVDNHILRLRQKLETEPTRPKHFHTVHGAGYKFLP